MLTKEENQQRNAQRCKQYYHTHKHEATRRRVIFPCLTPVERLFHVWLQVSAPLGCKFVQVSGVTGCNGRNGFRRDQVGFQSVQKIKNVFLRVKLLANFQAFSRSARSRVPLGA